MEYSFNEILRKLRKYDGRMYDTDFLLTQEKSQDDIKQLLYVAMGLKYLYENNISTKCFNSGLGISIFRDKSTRTRFSFASAANLLGLTVSDLDEEKSQISHGETVRETANMISFMTEIIGIRDDMYIGMGNSYMREVGQALDEGFAKGVLPQRPGIVNLQCDIDHPTQSLADLLHLYNYFGSFRKLKGKKIAMTWAYSPSYGKPLSVPQGIISLMTRFGMEVVLAHPEGYDLLPESIEVANQHANEYDGSFKVVKSMDEAFQNADIVYPKSWAPFSVMQRRTELLKNSDKDGLKVLEKECLENNAKYKDWTCTQEKMKLTKGGKALYMHCLPADITGVSCVEGEVEKEVFEKYRINTYIEAGYKPYVIAAMMLTNRFSSPYQLLKSLYTESDWRVRPYKNW